MEKFLYRGGITELSSKPREEPGIDWEELEEWEDELDKIKQIIFNYLIKNNET